jgi:hypothetical protein
MVSLAEYFAANRYKGKFEFGARVFGYWNKIPFVGSVGTDSVISEVEGPRVTVTLDLPIKYQDKVHNVLVVKPKVLSRLVAFGEEKVKVKVNKTKNK